MHSAAIVLLLVGFASANLLVPSGRVVNGTNAEEGEFPFIVSLRFYGSHGCGASIIQKQWILTAAHCVQYADPKSLTIQYGVNQISYSGPTIANVEDVLVHEKYNPYDNYVNDIALLKLTEPIEYNDRVQPVDLPKQRYEVREGTTVVLAGWGYKRTGGSVEKNLQKVDLVSFSDEECNRRHHGETYKSHLCGGVPEGGKGQCSGDSGGPLVLRNVQLGIVSWSRKPCAVYPYPGVYTKVSHYVDWINDKVSNN